MKKFASLITVLVLVLCLATTAFAAEEQVYNVYAAADMPANITLAAGEIATININDWTMMGSNLVVAGANAEVVVNGWTKYESVDGKAAALLEGMRGCSVTIENKGTESVTYALEVVIPLGSMNNPEQVVLSLHVAELNVTTKATSSYEYYYTYTAPGDGEFSLNNISVKTEGVDFHNVELYLKEDPYTTTNLLDENWEPTKTSVSFELKKGDVLIIYVKAMDYDYPGAETVNVTMNAGFSGHALEHNEAEEATCHGQGWVEYWYCTECDCYFLDAEATKITNAKDVLVPAKGSLNVTHYDAVAATCHDNGNVEYWYCADCKGYYLDKDCTQLSNALSVISGATGSDKVEHYKAVDATCHSNGNIEHWYCPDCDSYFVDEACTQETTWQRTVLGALGSTNKKYVEAADPYCHHNGNQEHWICLDCGGYFMDSNLTQETIAQRVIIPAEVTMEYSEAVKPTCHSQGWVEHWYCAECDCYFLDAAGTMNTNAKNVLIPALGTENMKHVEAADPYCHRNGNVEHWVCGDCGAYFMDAEGTKQTIAQRVIVPAEVTMEYTAEVPACHNNGIAEHWYCPECDCYFTDAQGIFNIAYKSLTILGDLDELQHVEAVAATETENGMKEHWYCAGCDCYFTDAEGKYNIARLSLVIPATGKADDSNPETGDLGVLAPVISLAVSAIGGVAVVAKKKEF